MVLSGHPRQECEQTGRAGQARHSAAAASRRSRRASGSSPRQLVEQLVTAPARLHREATGYRPKDHAEQLEPQSDFAVVRGQLGDALGPAPAVLDQVPDDCLSQRLHS